MSVGLLTERFRFSPSDFSRFSLGSQTELVYSTLTGDSRILPVQSLNLAQHCRTFQTLDAHADSICQQFQMSNDKQPRLRKALEQLVQSGLLVSHTALLHCIKSTAGPESAKATVPPITQVGIPTRNRPDMLQRCLSSYAEGAQKYGRSLEFVIMDASDDHSICRRNRAVATEIKQRLGTKVQYAGQEEKSEYVRRLAEIGNLPQTLLSLALLNQENYPISIGCSRNALLLDSIDALALMVDDDTICSIAPSPQVYDKITFTSKYDPTEFWFINAEEKADFDAAFGPGDMFAYHEQLLGQSPGAFLSQTRCSTEAVDVELMSSKFARKLSGGQGVVAVTALGIAGDSGMGSTTYLLTFDGPARQRLISSEEAYRYALAHRQVRRSVTSATISEGAFCMGINLGLDNRQVLPPFMPVQRNEDGIFGVLVRSCVQGACFGYLPWMLLHKRPEGADQALNNSCDQGRRQNTGEMLETMLALCDANLGFGDSPSKLLLLGQWLENWGRAPLRDFDEKLRSILWTQCTRQATSLTLLLERFEGQPQYWSDDVHALLSANIALVEKEEFSAPFDLATKFGEDQALVVFQRLILGLGEILQIWPQVRAAARDLRSQGHRLGTDVS